MLVILRVWLLHHALPSKVCLHLVSGISRFESDTLISGDCVLFRMDIYIYMCADVYIPYTLYMSICQDLYTHM
jgi:hypothetical protein